MIRLLARIYTQTDYQTSYRSLPKLVLDGRSVSSINRANIVDKNSYHAARIDVSHNAFLNSRSEEKNIFFDVHTG